VGFGVLVLSFLSLSEFYRLVNVGRFYQWSGYLCTIALVTLLLMKVKLAWLPILLLFFIHAVCHLVPGRGHRSPRFQSALVAVGFLFITQALSFSIFIAFLPNGAWWLFLCVAATAFCDVGAFWVGKGFGRHKLSPRLSPSKTIEGALGGVLFSVLVALGVGQVLQIPWGHRMVMGLLIALAAILGDLAESYVKRKVGVKDSGTLIPGHGGILDRLDSHLFAIPTYFVYLTFVLLNR